MASGAKQLFVVGELARVRDALKTLAEKAAREGLTTELLQALNTIVARLQTEPLTWGEPEYHLKKPGGVMYHAVCEPLVVKYAAYELERTVLILKIEPVSRSPLAS